MSGSSQASPGGAAVLRRRRIPSAAKGDGRKDRAAQQHRPTLQAQEQAPPYRADSSPSPSGGESAGVRGEVGQGSALRFIDLFCGIGGFRLAFERAGARCVFSSDWDKYSRQTYAANFGETPHGDIHSVAVADIPKFDILCGGFPCQPFSLAGVSKKNSLGRQHGFADEKQGNLFFSIAEILDYHQPPAFVLENVKHLVRHDQGRTVDESQWDSVLQPSVAAKRLRWALRRSPVGAEHTSHHLFGHDLRKILARCSERNASSGNAASSGRANDWPAYAPKLSETAR